MVLTGSVYAAFWSNIILGISILVLAYLFLRDAKTKYAVNLLVTYLGLTFLLGLILLAHFIIVPLSNDVVSYLTLYFRFTVMGLFFVYVKNKGLDFSYLLQSVLKWIAFHAAIGFISVVTCSHFNVRKFKR